MCPYEVPVYDARPRHRPQVRPVPRPAGRGRGAGVRAGLPDRGHQHHRRDDGRAGGRGPGRDRRRGRPPTLVPTAPRLVDHRARPPATARPRRCRPTHGGRRPVLAAAVARPHPAGGDAGAHPAVGRRRSSLSLAARRPARRRPGRGSPASPCVARRCSPSAPACCTSAARCYAWRAVLGLRHSWLSREIVAFGAVRRRWRPPTPLAALGRRARPGAPRPRRRAWPSTGRGRGGLLGR